MSSRLIIVGGFLGAGKTTLILQAAQMLQAQGVSVAIITNDQGNDLVDTALASEQHIPAIEVPAGCFCCRFDALVDAAQKLERETSPAIILAEPVGSCTDLNATVVLPLELMYREHYTVAPLTILVDAQRLLHFVRRGAGHELHSDLAYLFTKQIEEAERVLLNKCDLLLEEELDFLCKWLQIYCPGIQIRPIAAQSGEGIAPWITDMLVAPARSRPVLDLDYARYGQAEARLGWFNAGGTLSGERHTHAQDWAEQMLETLVNALETARLPIAHIKLFLEAPQAASGKPAHQIIKASVVGPAPALISWDARDQEMVASGTRWLLNARVDASPDILRELAAAALRQAHADAQAVVETLACFQPAPPQPQYRYSC
ncbi:MAG TPA: GTP-binding protein [Ktedonobacteraceae bacterium]|nr:GTP-binding protein [Ktedonobacteraceae bacterium]